MIELGILETYNPFTSSYLNSLFRLMNEMNGTKRNKWIKGGREGPVIPLLYSLHLLLNKPFRFNNKGNIINKGITGMNEYQIF